MATANPVLRILLNKAEAKLGFRFACQLHQSLMSGAPESRKLIRQALA